MISLRTNKEFTNAVYCSIDPIVLVWLLILLLEGLRLLFGAFVPNHVKGLNPLGLFLTWLFPDLWDWGDNLAKDISP